MKVRVVKPFKDKHTKVVYQVGQEIEVTKERHKELISAALGPFVEVPEAEKKEAEKKPRKATTQKKASNKAKK